MTKCTTALLAATLTVPIMIAVPAMAAPHQNRGLETGHAQAPGHIWKKGERFDRRKATHYQVIDYRKYRALKAPPRGYHYVRAGNDVLLVGTSSGIVASVRTGLFR